MNEQTYVSLTTVPPRFSNVGKTLESLLFQKAEIFEIRLVIPRLYLRFPDWNGDLPKVPKGVKIQRCKKDLGPACKIFSTLQNISDPNSYILYCDDDCEYLPQWAQSFKSHPEQKNSAIAGSIFNVERLRKKNGSILQGFGGVLVRKKYFKIQDFRIPKPYHWVDDIWISTCLEKNKIPIVENSGAKHLIKNSYQDQYGLQNTIFSKKNRAELNRIAVNYSSENFKIWT